MQRFFLIILIFVFGSVVSSAQNVPPDIHVVKKGETLYSLAQTYNTTVSHLLDLNPEIVDNKLKVSTSIKVPRLTQIVSKKKVKIGPPEYLKPITYEVSKGETVYSISKKMDITVESLRMWNDLKEDKIKTGQKLIVGYNDVNYKKNNPGSLKTLSTNEVKKENTGTQEIKNSTSPNVKTSPSANLENSLSQTQKSNQIKKEEKPTSTVVAPNVKADTNKTKPGTFVTTPVNNQNSNNVLTSTDPVSRPLKNSPDSKLVYLTEKGIATWTKGNNDDGQFYALHPTATVGTMISIKNMMNSKSIQVKVIGKLPNTADNQNVMIKLSNSAAKALNVLDDKFLATINYMGFKSIDEALK